MFGVIFGGLLGYALLKDEQKKKEIQKTRGNANIDLVCSYVGIHKIGGGLSIRRF